MRISRKRRPQKPLIPLFRKNEQIRVPEVRVLGKEGENLGVMPTMKAIDMARGQEMDLVEINPKAEPPVVKIIEFTHFKYQKEKEARKQKSKQHISEIKGIRLSIRIGDHDLEIRKIQAERFLDRGDKVKAEVILRGRENAHPQMAFEVIRRFYENLAESKSIHYEQPIAKQGNKVTAIIVKR